MSLGKGRGEGNLFSNSGHSFNIFMQLLPTDAVYFPEGHTEQALSSFLTTSLQVPGKLLYNSKDVRIGYSVVPCDSQGGMKKKQTGVTWR